MFGGEIDLDPCSNPYSVVNARVSYELPYHHFSVVFHRKRRLACFTAVNIDGRTPLREKREADKWSYDPRIEQQVQVGDDFYKGTPFDRGHLVRRLQDRDALVCRSANAVSRSRVECHRSCNG